MLVANSKLQNIPVFSVQTGTPIGYISRSIVDPNTLKIIAFLLSESLSQESAYLDVQSIREYSSLGIIVDSIDELVAPDEVVKLNQVLELNFDLTSLKVETRKGTKLGRVIDYTVSPDDFIVSQIIVKRPLIKSLNDSTLTIPRQEIFEITDYKIIVKDEENIIKARTNKEDFVPNFVNPFREKQPGYVPADVDQSSSTTSHTKS